MTNVLVEIARLESLDQVALKERWRELFGDEPPAYRRGFLVKGLAFRVQELAHGGLAPAARTRLDRLAEEQEKATPEDNRRRADAETLMIGTTLVREWDGVNHQVTVIDGGFEWQGRKYKSLSAVARAITGTRWNGWLFFGLRKHGKTT